MVHNEILMPINSSVVKKNIKKGLNIFLLLG